jgi:RimJ/RimL family protein N-acetyltransferase
MEAAYAASREHLRPWMAWAADEPLGVPARRAWIQEQNAIEARGGDRVRGAFLADGTLVGAGGLHRRIGPDAWEIGYWVHAAWTRRGIASALATTLAEEAFADDGIACVEIHHDAGNVASEGVPRRLGFTFVEECARPPLAPADGPIERIWRLTREQHARRAALVPSIEVDGV